MSDLTMASDETFRSSSASIILLAALLPIAISACAVSGEEPPGVHEVFLHDESGQRLQRIGKYDTTVGTLRTDDHFEDPAVEQVWFDVDASTRMVLLPGVEIIDLDLPVGEGVAATWLAGGRQQAGELVVDTPEVSDIALASGTCRVGSWVCVRSTTPVVYWEYSYRWIHCSTYSVRQFRPYCGG